jgi:hypothetical protein
MAAGVKKFTQPWCRQRDSVRPGDAEHIKALRARHLDQRRLERVRRQKSRLA